MPFGVSERQGRSPGPAKHQPPLDIEAPPPQFDICEEMTSRVRGEIYVWLARVRRASSRSALVEQNDPIDRLDQRAAASPWSSQNPVEAGLSLERESIALPKDRIAAGALPLKTVYDLAAIDSPDNRWVVTGSQTGSQDKPARLWLLQMKDLIHLARIMVVSAQRIYQDLVGENGFTDSYQSVKRFVRKLRTAQPERIWRLECQSGEELQSGFRLGSLL
jgi:hypothetical protein